MLRSPPVRKALIGSLIGLASAVVSLWLGTQPFAEVVELKSYDWRMRYAATRAPANPEIVLVTIDEESLRGLEPLVGRWPWPRLVHAQLLNYLTRARPRAILYDVLFTEQDRTRFFVQDEEWSGTASDTSLADAARGLPVVMPGDAVPEALEGGAEPPAVGPMPGLGLSPELEAEARPVFVPPIPPLAATSRVVAHNFAALDADGPWRRYVPFIRHQGQVIPSLAIATAAVALGIDGAQIRTDAAGVWIGSQRLPLAPAGPDGLERRALIRFQGRGPAEEAAYRRVSFYRLFYSEQQLLEGAEPLERPDRFRDAIVVVGATASATYDVFTTPVAGKMGGLEVHANVVDSILTRRTIEPAARWGAVALTIAAAVLVGAAGVFLGPWLTFGVSAVVAAAVIAATTWQFVTGFWYPLVVPLLAIALTAVGDVAYEYFVEGREKRRVKKIFSQFVSRDIYQQLLDNPTGANLGGHRRRMSVLFSDIRGFTTLSEQGPPELVVSQLNEYFSRMVPIVFAHKGTVDKFVGDMIMALFGAPIDDPDHADHAVQTALAMSEGLAKLNREWRARGRPPLDIGIGVNTGDMVAGNLGSSDIMSYTVIGDEVNLGARLESLNKDYGTRIIISEATRAALRGQYDVRALGDVVVKGKTVPVRIYAVAPPETVVKGLNAGAPVTDNSGKAGSPPGFEEQGTV
jgi:adenylate cyclase